MILFFASILFLAAFGGGLVFLSFPAFRTINLRNLLVFAASYLFALTIVHILPELYQMHPHPTTVGIFILLGFFIQLFLEFFSQGVEHGHIHHENQEQEIHRHTPSAFTLLVGLGVHSFLEGMIVGNPSPDGSGMGSVSILIGILLHKIPAAFALTTIFYFAGFGKIKTLIYLVIFSIASPAGLVFAYLLNVNSLISNTGIASLNGVVGGTFLYISTTIFFETSPEHQLKPVKLILALAGVLFAILAQVFI